MRTQAIRLSGVLCALFVVGGCATNEKPQEPAVRVEWDSPYLTAVQAEADLLKLQEPNAHPPIQVRGLTIYPDWDLSQYPAEENEKRYQRLKQKVWKLYQVKNRKSATP